MDLSKLAAPFPRASVHWRIQGTPKPRDGRHYGLALAYIDARDVMDRLDSVCGIDGWQSEFTETARGRIVCRIGIRTPEGWVWKADGAGDTDVEGEKGALSDALKRAAVSWGIGRYLYRLSSPWVPCDVRDNNGKIAWRKWSADPWSFVGDAPEEQSQTEVEAAIANIKAQDTLADLGAWWAGFQKAQKAIAGMPEVLAAKDQRKGELTMKETHQGAG